MANTYTVLLSELVSEFNLDFFYKSTDFDKIRVTVDDISRPGLHLAGFFDHYEPMRVYVCGTVETAYLQKLSPEERIIIFDHFLSYKCPALIFARGFEPMPECLEMAKKYDVTVLGTKDTTSYIVSSLITYLKSSLAPSLATVFWSRSTAKAFSSTATAVSVRARRLSNLSNAAIDSLRTMQSRLKRCRRMN